MTSESLRALLEKVRDLGEETTFADLSEAHLLDLALGWHDGRPYAAHAAALLSRIDELPVEGRDRELAGRALLTLLARRRTGVVPETAAENVRLLGDPAVDEGDPEGLRAWERREAEYRSLTESAPPYDADEFARDAAAAFDAARDRAAEGGALEPDAFGARHRLALLGHRLPPGLRAHFRERCGPELSDATAWRFVLVSKALARHGDEMRISGAADPAGLVVPQRLVEALLATDLGELARTALRE